MKKFIEKKKLDYKFAKAGAGHSLAETSSSSRPPPPQQSSVRERQHPGQASQLAGTAALSRLDQQSGSGACKPKLRNTTAYKEMETEVRRAEEAKQKLQQQRSHDEPVTLVASHRNVSINMICPLCHRLFPYNDTKKHFMQCLQEEFPKEPLTGSVNMIHTLCFDVEKKKSCIDVLSKYLNNLIENGSEEKYRKIRMNNKTFQEKVSVVTGAILFLEAIGFEQQSLPHQGNSEQFLVIPEAKAKDMETLKTTLELLETSKAIVPLLDRNIKLFRPTSKATHFDLTDDFYKLTVEEIKREVKAKSEAAEKELQLRTKKMREKDELKTVIRHYRFVLLRIRFPDGIILQGVFKPLERISDVRQFICNNLEREECPFSLSVFSTVLSDDTISIAQAGLAPASVLNLVWSTPDLIPKPPYFKKEINDILTDIT